MENLNAARAFIGDSLGFHIIFALLGVGLPLVTMLVEWWSVRSNNPTMHAAAQFLSRVMVLLVVVGVVSGTMVAIQLSLIWPGLVNFGDAVLGAPFMLEGYAFLLEAVFLAWYVSSWKTLKGYTHVLLLIPVNIGATMSAVFITLANAWMNSPKGFEIVNGQMVNVQLWKALFTWTAFYEISHSVLSYFLATFLVVAGACAWYIYKHKPTGEHRSVAFTIMHRLLILAFVCELLVAIVGHFSLQYLAQDEPRKFAALERVFETQTHAPYIVGGEVSEDKTHVQGGIRIPHALSILTGNRADTRIIGLNEFAREDWPPFIINTLFDIKMLFVGVICVIPLVYGWFWRRKKEQALNKWMMIALVASGPLAIVIIELGWMVTELGRQPFAISGYLRTADAFTNQPGIMQWGFIFPVLFVVLFVVTGIALNRLIKKNRV